MGRHGGAGFQKDGGRRWRIQKEAQLRELGLLGMSSSSRNATGRLTFGRTGHFPVAVPLPYSKIKVSL